MPALSTFGGASARSFGRAIEVQPPIFPAGTTVMWNNDVSEGLPVGWQYLQDADERFILATTNSNEIGETTNLQGKVSSSSSYNSLSDGIHSGGSFASPRFGSSGIYSVPYGQGGNHSHSMSPVVDLTDSFHLNNTNLSPYVDIPFIYTMTDQDRLPPRAVVFRGNTPASVNYQAFQDIETLPTSFTHAFRCAQTREFAEKTELRWLYGGLSGSNGNHSHPDAQRTGGSLSATVFTYVSNNQNHQHNMSVQCRLQVKAKQLRLWTSFFEESLESGMIVMYIGNISNLPSGWRVCNGNNNTPDMGTYYLGYRGSVGSNHDFILSSSNVFEFNDADLDEFTWLHTHQGNQYTTSVSSGLSSHFSANAPHSHGVTASTVRANDRLDIPYVPPSFKLCFIQYKGL